jgi:hypothetical protein
MNRLASCRAAFAVLLIGLAFLMGPADARAQASISASAQVLLPATTGAGVRAISMGNVMPGTTTSRTIAAFADSTATGVGFFNFTGINGNRDVQLTFDFPSVLTHSGSGNTMPISFNGSYGLYCFDRNSGLHACSLFNPSPGGADPSVVVITPAAAPRNGIMRVYLGASVSPIAAISAGVYQGTVTVTMVRL